MMFGAAMVRIQKCVALKINPHLRVIVSTGHSLDARELLRLGSQARGFVKKPYEVRQMVETVKEALGSGEPSE